MPAESAGSPACPYELLARSIYGSRGKESGRRRIVRPIYSTRSLAILSLAGLALAACSQASTRPISDGSRAISSKGVGYLASQQQADGGFEVAGFPGFETPDAIAAIAAHANIDTLEYKAGCVGAANCTEPGDRARRAWSATNARAAVAAIKTPAGLTPLVVVDDFAEGPTLNAGQAAKLIVLVSEPLGYDSGAFDPAGDGAPENLVGDVLSAYNSDGTFGPAGSFNVTLYSALATKLSLGSVPKATAAAIVSAQRTDGGWNYTGSAASATLSDIDTTALALQALVASLPDTTPAWETTTPNATQAAITKAVAFLASKHQSSGGFGSTAAGVDPNSTAVAILALRSVGFNPAQPCWRNAASPSLKGTGFESPVAWLAIQQGADGRVKSPNDAYGVNTFTTSQVVQAAALSWFPIAERELVLCSAENLNP